MLDASKCQASPAKPGRTPTLVGRSKTLSLCYKLLELELFGELLLNLNNIGFELRPLLCFGLPTVAGRPLFDPGALAYWQRTLN